jgi:hypothetical protein
MLPVGPPVRQEAIETLPEYDRAGMIFERSHESILPLPGVRLDELPLVDIDNVIEIPAANMKPATLKSTTRGDSQAAALAERRGLQAESVLAEIVNFVRPTRAVSQRFVEDVRRHPRAIV